MKRIGNQILIRGYHTKGIRNQILIGGYHTKGIRNQKRIRRPTR